MASEKTSRARILIIDDQDSTQLYRHLSAHFDECGL